MSLIHDKQWVKAVTALQFSQRGHQPLPAADVFEIRGEDANTLPWWGAADARRAACHDAGGVWTKEPLYRARPGACPPDTGHESCGQACGVHLEEPGVQ